MSLFQSLTTRKFVGVVISIIVSLAVADGVHAGDAAVRPFPLSQVRLLDGPFKSAMQVNRKTLDEIGADRALYCFRVQAGLPTKGAKPLAGWAAPENEGGPFPGHFESHYLSACSLMYAQTGDKAMLDRVNYMVAELGKCQKAMDGKYLFASPSEEFNADRLDGVAWYRMHKLMAGLLDAYTYCGNKQALEISKNLADWVKSRMDEYTAKNQWDRVKGVEYGGMQEALVNLYGITRDSKYDAMSRLWAEKDKMVDPLAQGKDVVGGHANTYFAKMVGVAQTSLLDHDTNSEDAVRNFWGFVVESGHRTYAEGGTSVHEWVPSANRLANTMEKFPQETCVTYNMLKVTRTLASGGSKYHDYYERALWNAILGSQDPETGWKTYYQPTDANSVKDFRSYLTACHCCNGTGLESFSKLGDSIYFHDARTLYVCQFIASRVAFNNLVLEQTTSFPAKPTTTIKIKVAKPKSIAIAVRKPGWCESGFVVRVNSVLQKNLAVSNGFVIIDRKWKNGDRIDVTAPMHFSLYPMPDKPNQVTFMYGPIAMVGIGARPYMRELVGDMKDPKSWVNNLDKWFKPVKGEPLTFTGTDSAARMVTFRPYHTIGQEFFTGYFDVVDKPTYQDDGNVALGTKATASSYGWAMAPAKAVDGNADDSYLKWVADGRSLPQWWMLDLGKNFSIARCETTFEFPDQTYKYKIESSVDGKSWNIFADRSNDPTKGNPSYTDSGSATARYLRVTILGSEKGSWASIKEFKAFETPSN